MPWGVTGGAHNVDSQVCQGGLWAHYPHQVQGGAHLPGTTPLVAMALMEMAVSKVCGKVSLGKQLSMGYGQPWPLPQLGYSHSSSR